MKTLRVRQDMGTVDKTGKGRCWTGQERRMDPEKEAPIGQDRKDTLGQNNNEQQRTKRGRTAGQERRMLKEGQGRNDMTEKDRQEPDR
jgi:hypothetical protein